MDLEYIIQNKYSDILGSQTLMTPTGNKTHITIKFDLFVERMLGNKNMFINQKIFEGVYQKVINRYNNGLRSSNESYFKSYGDLKTISIESLKFYQREVGISGPKHSNIHDPVLIIKSDLNFILYNGYHRLLYKIISGEKTIQGFILVLDN